jgi:hypothetical protein
MIQRKIREAAVHEAGHAVLLEMLDVPYDHVSIAGGRPRCRAGGRLKSAWHLDLRSVFAADHAADSWIAPGVLGTLRQRRAALDDNPNRKLVAWLKGAMRPIAVHLDAEIAAALRR